MSQVSTEAYDFIFARRDVLARRIDKMETRIAKSERKLEKLNNKKEPDLYEIGRVEGLLESRTARLNTLQADYDELIGVPLPEDSFGISNIVKEDKLLSLDVNITDSPYDDLFDGADGFRLRVTGTKVKANGGTSTATSTLTFDGGGSFVDNSTDFPVGSSTFLEIAGRESGSYQVLSNDGNNTVLYELAFNNVV